MKTVLKSIVVFGLSVTILIAQSAVASQIESDFEAGDFRGWQTQGEGWSVVSGKYVSSGKKAAKCFISKGEQPGLKAFARVLESAEPGWVVSVKMDVASKLKTLNSRAKAVIICVDSGGNTLREIEHYFKVATPDFYRVTLPELIVPSGTVETYLMIVVEVADMSQSKEFWLFDNIQVIVN